MYAPEIGNTCGALLREQRRLDKEHGNGASAAAGDDPTRTDVPHDGDAGIKETFLL
jgi:hypothetical protein